MALEDVGDRSGGDRSVRRVKGRVDMRLGGDCGGELRGLDDSDVIWRGDGVMVRVIASGPRRDLERSRQER